LIVLPGSVGNGPDAMKEISLAMDRMRFRIRPSRDNRDSQAGGGAAAIVISRGPGVAADNPPARSGVGAVLTKRDIGRRGSRIRLGAVIDGVANLVVIVNVGAFFVVSRGAVACPRSAVTR